MLHAASSCAHWARRHAHQLVCKGSACVCQGTRPAAAGSPPRQHGRALLDQGLRELGCVAVVGLWRRHDGIANILQRSGMGQGEHTTVTRRDGSATRALQAGGGPAGQGQRTSGTCCLQARRFQPIQPGSAGRDSPRGPGRALALARPACLRDHQRDGQGQVAGSQVPADGRCAVDKREQPGGAGACGGGMAAGLRSALPQAYQHAGTVRRLAGQACREALGRPQCRVQTRAVGAPAAPGSPACCAATEVGPAREGIQ